MVIQGPTTAKKKVTLDEERSNGVVECTEQLGLINRLTTDPPNKTATPHISDGTLTPGIPQNQQTANNVFGTYY